LLSSVLVPISPNQNPIKLSTVLNLPETAFYIKPNASSKKAKEDYVQLAIRKQAKQQAIDSKKPLQILPG
jgi:hypothetical protein